MRIVLLYIDLLLLLYYPYAKRNYIVEDSGKLSDGALPQCGDAQ